MSGQTGARSFLGIKKRLTSAPILALTTNDTNFVVHSDAFKNGLRCVLMQDDRVIAYSS